MSVLFQAHDRKGGGTCNERGGENVSDGSWNRKSERKKIKKEFINQGGRGSAPDSRRRLEKSWFFALRQSEGTIRMIGKKKGSSGRKAQAGHRRFGGEVTSRSRDA